MRAWVCRHVVTQRDPAPAPRPCELARSVGVAPPPHGRGGKPTLSFDLCLGKIILFFWLDWRIATYRREIAHGDNAADRYSFL